MKMFQFQTGAIKRAFELRNFSQGLHSFNSKLVRLKGFYPLRVQLWGAGFNSKLVRLKVGYKSACRPGWFVFQFQTGAIKRRKG